MSYPYVARLQQSLWDVGADRARRLDGLTLRPKLVATSGSGVAFFVSIPAAFDETGEIQTVVLPLESETLSEALQEVDSRFPVSRWLGKTEGELQAPERLPTAAAVVYGVMDPRFLIRAGVVDQESTLAQEEES